MRKLMRKRIVAPIAAIAVLALAGIAIAYFTASGTGSGSGSVGTDAGLTITNVSFDSPLYPGAGSVVRFTINNPSTDAAVRVSRVIADTTAGTNGITGLTGGCLAADFRFDAVTIDASIGAGSSLDAAGTIAMAETGANQDACQGQSPVLNLKVDNSGI